MTKKNRFIPFNLTPAAWGLVGSSYQEAEANYYYDGIELEYKLNDIRNEDNKLSHGKRKLEIDRKFGLLTDDEFHKAVIELETPENSEEREIALIEMELSLGKITKLERDKQIANVKQEPWIGLIDNGFDPSQGLNGVYFEFDWNDLWIGFLRENGYTGFTEEQVVEQWFSDVCRSQAEGTPVVTDEPVPFNSRGPRPRFRTDNY